MHVERALLRRYGSDSQADDWDASSNVDCGEAERVRTLLRDASFETSLVPIVVMRLSKDRWAILQAIRVDDSHWDVHAFFVDESTYATFAYHPVQLLDEAIRAVESQANGTEQLRPIVLRQPSAFPIERHLTRAIERWTIHQIAVLLDCLLIGPKVAALINDRPRSVVSAMYSLLPPACRAEFTCSGLTDSSVVPFHALFLSDDAAVWSPMLEAGGISIFDWSSDMPITTDLIHPWSQLVVRELHDGCVRTWLKFVGQLSPRLSLEDLRRLAQTELDKPRESRLEFEIDAIAMNFANDFELCFQEDVGSDCRPAGKSALDLSREEVLEQLDRLDDAAFDAIGGSDGGLSRLEELWPQIKSQLSANLVEESREQYVRLIVDQCQQSNDREATSTAAVIDVLKLLFN